MICNSALLLHRVQRSMHLYGLPCGSTSSRSSIKTSTYNYRAISSWLASLAGWVLCISAHAELQLCAGADRSYHGTPLEVSVWYTRARPALLPAKMDGPSCLPCARLSPRRVACLGLCVIGPVSAKPVDAPLLDQELIHKAHSCYGRCHLHAGSWALHMHAASHESAQNGQGQHP